MQPSLLAQAVLTGLALTACTRPAGTASAPGAERPEITVFAAASLREGLAEIAAPWQEEARARVVFNFGSSGDLARQIVAGGGADLFLSADEQEMDRVAEEGLLEEGPRATILSNQLVVIVPAQDTGSRSSFELEDLASPRVRLLSLAHPEAVPAGRYARAWLVEKELWERVRERVLPGVDVRAALAAVESGAAEAGIVYRTDAARSKRVRVVHAVPSGEGPPIAYAAAVLAEREAGALARAFLDHLSSPPARAVFERHGFVLPPER